MSLLDLQAGAAVAAACRANAAEIAAALGRALGAAVQVAVEEPRPLAELLQDGALAGAGLAVLLQTADGAAAALLPAAGGVVPAWFTLPDASGASKLATLAQELGNLLLPPDCPAESCDARATGDLAGALRQGKPQADGTSLSLRLRGEQVQGRLVLAWPLSAPESLFVAESASVMPSPSAAPAAPKKEAGRQPRRRNTDVALGDLPSYSRSLLKIEVPVTVTLAAKKHPAGQVLELGQGSIIQFEKNCDEMLEVDIGGRVLAAGEAVKVGDKFGVRITSMILPGERFVPVRAPKK